MLGHILAYAKGDAIALLVVAGVIVLVIAVGTLNKRFNDEPEEKEER